MGPEIYAKWLERGSNMALADPEIQGVRHKPDHRRDLTKLRMRLSYTTTPLQEEQATRMVDRLATASAKDNLNAYFSAGAMVSALESESGLLEPEQWKALRDLAMEERAWRERSRLPKSSELPRNVRRNR